MVVLTRPIAESTRWAAELQTHGVTTSVLPLLEIVPPDDPAPVQQAWARLAHYEAVFFVSSNAVNHFFHSNAAEAPIAPAFSAMNIRAWAPGPGTAAALRGAGVAASQIDQPAADAQQFDSEALWAVVQAHVRPAQRVLIVRGMDAQGQLVGRDWLAQQLGAAGVQVDQLGAYQRRVPHWQPAQREQAEAAFRQHALWLFSSAEAVLNLQRLVPDLLEREAATARAMATHPRVASAAHSAGFRVVRESQPTLAAVLTSIKSDG